jgi:hypothetical protein
MAKRGRKPKGEKKIGYFDKPQEDAFVKYINETNKIKKERIFNEYLLPAFTKMIESIIRRYNLYIPDEDFNDTFNDVMSFLITKINNFKQDSNFKAYSYTGTIIKNYLIYKINTYNKNQKRTLSCDTNSEEISNNSMFTCDNSHSSSISFLNELISESANKIKSMIDEKEKYGISKDEITVGNALIDLMENWSDIFEGFRSNKFNKSAVLFSLKEMTNMDTKTIRNSMKKYKVAYYDIKKKMLQ